MKSKLFGKILLFGEYVISLDANGIILPCHKFYGKLLLDKSLAFNSIYKLNPLFEYLKNLKPKIYFLNLDKLDIDINSGLVFKSNIPQGYGLGSSGALTSAIYKEYNTKPAYTIKHILESLSIIESFFHGSSTGFDALCSYLNQPLLINNSIFKKININPEIEIIDYDKIEDIYKKNNKIFLIDSKHNSLTKNCIEVFKKQIKNPNFEITIKNFLIPYNNDCVKYYLKKEKLKFKKSLKKYSEISFQVFNELIPMQIKKLWINGLNTNNYYMKLCGSGGGGYFLLFKI